MEFQIKGLMMERGEKRGKQDNSVVMLIRIALFVILVLTVGGIVIAGDKKAKEVNEPNAVLLKKYDIPVKDVNDANEMMIAKYKAVIAVLQNKELSLGLKERIIEKIICPIFDFELMSKLSLGKTNWLKLTSDEQKKFTEMFTKHIKASYLGNIKLYKDETALFRPAVLEKTGISIAMDLVSDDTKTAIVYKLRRLDKRWKIYDVEIEGVSILLTYRSQFEDILKHGNVKDLFAHLEKEPEQK